MFIMSLFNSVNIKLYIPKFLKFVKFLISFQRWRDKNSYSMPKWNGKNNFDVELVDNILNFKTAVL